jgi:hypothetical protein
MAWTIRNAELVVQSRPEVTVIEGNFEVTLRRRDGLPFELRHEAVIARMLEAAQTADLLERI